MKIISMLLPHLKNASMWEIEMVELLIYGYNNKIVKILGISINTVKKHLSNIFSKLGISGRPQLVRFIIVNGLLDIWDKKYGLLEELQ